MKFLTKDYNRLLLDGKRYYLIEKVLHLYKVQIINYGCDYQGNFIS